MQVVGPNQATFAIKAISKILADLATVGRIPLNIFRYIPFIFRESTRLHSQRKKSNDLIFLSMGEIKTSIFFYYTIIKKATMYLHYSDIKISISSRGNAISYSSSLMI